MIATREAYGNALVELGQVNDKVVVLDADLANATKTIGFKKVFPNRFFDMGIKEADMIGTAAGLAACGKIPFASTFAVFAAGRAYDQIRNSVAYPKLNVKIAATHAGITVGEDGATHQMLEDIALMRVLPNMTVLCPCDEFETKWAINEATRINGPVYIRLGRSKAEEVYDDKTEFEFGKGKVVRDGSDVTVIATGLMVSEAVKAHERLKEEGISVRVIDIHTIKPLDRDIIIKAAKETSGIVTAEEHNVIGGLGGAVSEVLTETYPTRVLKVGVMDMFGKSGPAKELLTEFGLTAEDIIKNVKEIKFEEK